MTVVMCSEDVWGSKCPKGSRMRETKGTHGLRSEEKHLFIWRGELEKGKKKWEKNTEAEMDIVISILKREENRRNMPQKF